jgi:hypothetical protein
VADWLDSEGRPGKNDFCHDDDGGRTGCRFIGRTAGRSEGFAARPRTPAGVFGPAASLRRTSCRIFVWGSLTIE